MRFDTSMQVRLEQRMKLAPRMIQSMEILQLPLLALEERIQQELVANPVLEMEEPSETALEPPPAETAEAAEAAPDAKPEEERPLEVDANAGAEEFDRLDKMSSDWQDFFREEEFAPRSPRADGERDAKLDAMQNTAVVGENLQESLIEQVSYLTADPAIRDLAETIIRNLDDNGYLRVPLEDVLQDVRRPATLAQAEAALALVQRLEPAGVGARDLRECLLIQLTAAPADPEADLARRLVGDHLADIENNRYPQVARQLGITIDQVKAAVERLRRLNPKPGGSITTQVPHYIVPDVEIAYDERHDEYRVTIRDDRTPSLHIGAMFRKMVRDRGLDPKTREFVARNIRSARWLIDAIEQRRHTLQRVVLSIVKFQRPFLDLGPDHLEPLKMQQVADDVKLHVGTISRAVDEKYAQTSHGIFALRNFFTGGTETAGGETIAWDKVRNRLKEMVAAEDKSNPLSDEEIVERFKAEGIDLARRTVAKYRGLLDIPSSRRRKQF
jgi:RNA polymerase sigma-54 factor